MMPSGTTGSRVPKLFFNGPSYHPCDVSVYISSAWWPLYFLLWTASSTWPEKMAPCNHNSTPCWYDNHRKKVALFLPAVYQSQARLSLALLAPGVYLLFYSACPEKWTTGSDYDWSVTDIPTETCKMKQVFFKKSENKRRKACCTIGITGAIVWLINCLPVELFLGWNTKLAWKLSDDPHPMLVDFVSTLTRRRNIQIFG